MNIQSILLLVVLGVLSQLSVVQGQDLFGWLSKTFFGEGEVGADGTVAEVEQPPATLNKDQLSHLMEKSKDSIAGGKALESLPALMDIIDSEPNHHDANLLAGTALLNDLDRPDMAEAFLYRAVTSSEWRDIVAVAQLCFALIKSKEVDLAEKIVFQAFSKNDDIRQNESSKEAKQMNEILGNVLGMVYVKQKKYTEASNWFLTAANANPNSDADVWLKASTMQFPTEARDSKIAQSVLLQAVQALPDNPVLVFNLAVATFLGGDVEGSISLYQSAISLDSILMEGQPKRETSIPDAWASLGTAMHSVRRWQEGHDCYERAYKIQPNNYILLANWAKLLCDPSVNLMEQGREVANAALALDRTNSDVLQAASLCK